MHKLRDRSQPHRVDRESTLVYIALGSVLIVTLLALLMWYLHQLRCNARWGFIKALFFVIPVIVLTFVFILKFILKYEPLTHTIDQRQTATLAYRPFAEQT